MNKHTTFKIVRFLFVCLMINSFFPLTLSAQPIDVKKVKGWPFNTGLCKNKPFYKTKNQLLADNLYVVYDASGSMENAICKQKDTSWFKSRPKKISVARKAFTEFIKKTPYKTKLGIYVFAAKNQQLRALAPLANEQGKNTIIQQINQISPGGGTPLKSSIEFASKQLTLQACRQRGMGSYRLIVLTDGEASNNENPAKTVESIFKNTRIEPLTVGFCINKPSHSLRRADILDYYDASNTDEIVRGLSKAIPVEGQ